ncbi:hypothetical protein [Streptomyces sp. NPDC006971]|uniref:hypothetical protein n=1 Tax=Streptomyces sp. NPDC006971 TaxID=3154784 RepID=UPI0033CEA712
MSIAKEIAHKAEVIKGGCGRQRRSAATFLILSVPYAASQCGSSGIVMTTGSVRMPADV